MQVSGKPVGCWAAVSLGIGAMAGAAIFRIVRTGWRHSQGSGYSLGEFDTLSTKLSAS